MAALHGQLLLGHRLAHVETMCNAGAVGDHQRNTGPCFGFEQRLDGLDIAGAEGDLRDVDIAEGHCLQPEVLLGGAFAPGRELGDRAAWRGLRRLAARVRVHLGVQHENVHVAAAAEHVIKSAGADVVGPSVTADDPDRLADQRAE